jgi:adenosyl cobinamide kinase/adenosyl cobinamide phosphate guanylyltransferase
MSLVLVVGGARSGKSDFALRLAAGRRSPVVFIATGQGRDPEMAQRIARHRRERPESWETIEEPLHLLEAIGEAGSDGCVVIDCLTLWTANALEELEPAAVEAQAAEAADAASSRRGLTIAVTNEVGLGLVPDTPLGRCYRDVLGRVNAIWAEASDRALLLVAGRALELGEADSVIEGLL